MRSRMERYTDPFREKKVAKQTATSREDKNKNLYDQLYTNTSYTEYSDITDSNAVELGTLQNSYQTREGYQKMKEYQTVITPPKVKRELERFQELYPSDENKVYDINSVLLEAKKNRNEVDELEKKRKLRSGEYNILEDLNLEKIQKYKEERSKRRNNPKLEEEEIRELIDTITSKSLKSEIEEAEEKDLMSDLLPKSLEEPVVEPSLEPEGEEEKKQSYLENMDRSFFTKSMDLSDQDFEEVDEDDEFKEIEEKRIPLVVKILLFLILIAIFTTIFYFIIQRL